MNRIVTPSVQHALHRLISLGLALLLIFVSILTLAPSAQAQPPDEDLGEAAIWLTLFPELRVLPAPDVIQLGTRITYSAIGATPGGGAGGGIIQADVVTIGATTFAQVTHYGNNGADALIPLLISYSVALPAVGQFWINPEVLVNAERVANPNLSITRTTRDINGAAVNVVRFQTDLRGSRFVYEFSQASGVLVFSSVSVPGSQESQMTLLNVRQINNAAQAVTTASASPEAPAQDLRAPNWARPEILMEYTGHRSTTIVGSDTPPLITPYAVSAEIISATPNWSLISTTEFLAGAATGGGTLVTGIAQRYAPYWLPSVVLNSDINQRVLLDEDPYTGVQLTIERAPDNDDIILRQFAHAFEMAHRYNATLGSLDSFYLATISPTDFSEFLVTRTGGSNLVEANQLPPLPDEAPPPTPIPSATPIADVTPTPMPSTTPIPDVTPTSMPSATPVAGVTPPPGQTPSPADEHLYIPLMEK